MRATNVRRTGRRAAAMLAFVSAACGGDGGGPTGNGDLPAVAGNYNATFTAVEATGCQDFVTTGSSATGTLRVTQSGSQVTLHIGDLREEFASNPVGTISADGAFHFGPDDVVIDPEPDAPGDRFTANGTFDGMFTGDAMDIEFDFTLATCHVVGTIVGQR